MGEAKSPFTHPVGHKEEKVWGWWEILAQDPVYATFHSQVKLLHFNANAQMSLQLHRERAEVWTVIAGTGKAWVGDQHLIHLRPGVFVKVEKLQPHRILAEQVGLTLVEVQLGSYLGEDDLLRISDANGRTLGEVDPSNES